MEGLTPGISRQLGAPILWRRQAMNASRSSRITGYKYFATAPRSAVAPAE